MPSTIATVWRTQGRDRGRIVKAKARDPNAPAEPTMQGMDALPDGQFYLVFRVVRGMVQIQMESLPAKPVKQQPYRELKRVKLTVEQSKITVTNYYKLLQKEIAALQAKVDRELKA